MGNFVLEHDSVILFCFVLWKGLIVLGTSSTNPSDQLALTMQAMQALWQCFPVFIMIPISFLTLKNAMTMSWQWHYLCLSEAWFVTTVLVFVRQDKVIRQMYSLPGTEVPSATNTTAVTESFRPMVQPKWEARSPMKAVSTPIMMMETMKHAQPFQYSVGGTKAKRTFQNTVRKCIT